MDAPESCSMRECNKTLISGLVAVDVDAVADELYGALLLPDDVYASLQLSSIKLVKARKVIWNVNLKVKADPKYFNKFLSILRGYEGLQDLMKTLKATHRKFVSASTPVSETKAEATTSSAESCISQELLGQIVELESEFSRLTFSLLEKLKTDEVSVNYLTSIISTLPGDGKKYVYNSWLKIVEQCPFKTLDVLFTRLNADVWTFLDYYLVHHIISKRGSENLIREMKDYIIAVQKFKETTLVKEFISCWEGHPRNIPDYQKVEIKLTDTNITLARLDDLRKGLQQNFLPSLSNCAACVYYGHFNPGCCIVSLIVPVVLVKVLKEEKIKDCNLLAEFKVSYISVEDASIYSKHLPSQQAASDDEVVLSSTFKNDADSPVAPLCYRCKFNDYCQELHLMPHIEFNEVIIEKRPKFKCFVSFMQNGQSFAADSEGYYSQKADAKELACHNIMKQVNQRIQIQGALAKSVSYKIKLKNFYDEIGESCTQLKYDAFPIEGSGFISSVFVKKVGRTVFATGNPAWSIDEAEENAAQRALCLLKKFL